MAIFEDEMHTLTFTGPQLNFIHGALMEVESIHFHEPNVPPELGEIRALMERYYDDFEEQNKERWSRPEEENSNEK